jgi:hypothetical protein
MGMPSMPRYYFDLRDEDGIAVDEEGLELPNLQTVQAEAAKALADMARDAVYVAKNARRHHMAIEVRADFGPVMEVKFTFEIDKLMN